MAVVEQFQKPSGPPVFLISLKAGGSGLNLTAADTVIHFDPWWNPAVEDQATDRAHRIGQTRSVTTYRLIAKGTIEEKILELGVKKRELVGAVLSEDAGGAKKLTRADLDELFRADA
jgi:SNF2 family DNA or RNA helicase